MSFDALKKNYKSLYSAFPVSSPLCLTHMTPNRNIKEYSRAIQIKPSRYKTFYFEAMEHVLKNPE